jgi:hypothetical protein
MIRNFLSAVSIFAAVSAQASPFTVTGCTQQIADTAGFFTDSPLAYLEDDAGGNPFWIQTVRGSLYWLFEGPDSAPITSDQAFNNNATWYTNPNNVQGEFWVTQCSGGADRLLFSHAAKKLCRLNVFPFQHVTIFELPAGRSNPSVPAVPGWSQTGW